MIRKPPRLLIVTAFGALVVLASVAVLAWACTPQAYIDVGPASGPAGSSVTVTGRQFVEGPVEISWSGGGVLATAAGPSFSTTVKIPNASPGIYYVSAKARDANGNVVGSTARAFEVTGAAPPPVAAQPGATAPPAAAPAPARARNRERVSGRGGGDGRPSGRSRSAAQATTTPTVITSSGVHAFAGSVARPRSSVLAASRAPSWERGDSGRKAGSPRSHRGPSGRSATDNLWSGFDAGGRDAGLVGSSGPAVAPGPELIPGLALLGLGLVALAGGFGLAAVRRRRAASRTP